MFFPKINLIADCRECSVSGNLHFYRAGTDKEKQRSADEKKIGGVAGIQSKNTGKKCFEKIAFCRSENKYCFT
ncbi:MAG TPA: hypothetical protein DEV98_07985 [Clostridiales bacterium]|nr:hypothetical protein [Clostridiales bacterium]